MTFKKADINKAHINKLINKFNHKYNHKSCNIIRL